MGTIRKSGNEYYIEFEARGLKYQQKAGTDKQKAEALLTEVEAKIRKGEMDAVVRDADTFLFLEDYLREAAGRFDPRSARRVRAAVAHFSGFLRDHFPKIERLSEVTPKIIEAYKTQLARQPAPRVKPHTINLTLFLLRDMMDFAVKTGYLNDNPTLHIRLVRKGPARVPRTIPDEDLPVAETGDFTQVLERWRAKTGESAPVLRNSLAKKLLQKGAAPVRLYHIMGLTDVARIVYYTCFVPEMV